MPLLLENAYPFFPPLYFVCYASPLMTIRKNNALYGLWLACCGALMITPDTLVMRLSELHVWAMATWRGMEMGVILLLAWLISTYFRPNHSLYRDITSLCNPAAIGFIICTVVAAISFTYGIAETSVSIILFSLASAPFFAAIFSIIFLKESTPLSTYLSMVFCFCGVGLAVFGGHQAIAAPAGSVVIGAVCGLVAAAGLGFSFVCLRSNAHIALLPANGIAAMMTGLIAISIIFTTAQIESLFAGRFFVISLSGMMILPLSFLALTAATRYTSAANVSLFLLLETVLGPIWVWLGIGERPGLLTIMGGVIIICSLVMHFALTMHRLSRK